MVKTNTNKFGLQTPSNLFLLSLQSRPISQGTISYLYLNQFLKWSLRLGNFTPLWVGVLALATCIVHRFWNKGKIMDLTLNTNLQNTLTIWTAQLQLIKNFACNLHLKPYIHVSWYQSSNSLSQIWKRGFYPSVWRRQWHPTPVLLPGKSHGWRSLVCCSPWGRWELDTTERLHFDFSLSCTGEGNGNPLQCSCLENPRDGGAWWAAVYGVAQSWTRLKRLSSSSSNP